ncbi:hypothetical protein C3O70_07780 [Cronobacter sakazakii]|uniref:hypothetical protein n=1 Tax=Cronobacter sakazakii TaxID=28141 RepID=UPI000F5C950D|nr:hypothetical protein [Cronobacter sakazakii]MDT3545658.1 hypothetical protein [Cronobacter sakazakii]RRA25908.1 hypothetical protein C3O71_19845 [Cronobacter sakazakii]RRA33830.1 hypothetical protein C3O70_07780 [Cronobacter sakazakii]HDK7338403.1 hypothetical protein [Cronobacter sakazakii]
MNTAKLKAAAGCRDLLGVQKHANQHRLSRLVMEVHSDELRIIAAAVESYTDELIAALEAQAEEFKRSVRRESSARARIDELQADCREKDARIAELTDALKQAVSGYKSCLRTGHERIIELGGECDAPETMIAQNPDIRQAEKVLGINLETGGEA